MTKQRTDAPSEISPLSAAIEAAKQINAVVAALEARRGELTLDLRSVESEIALLWRMPLTRAEVKELALESVDALASEFVSGARWSDIVAPFAAPAGRRPRNDGPILHEQSSFANHETAINLLDLDAIHNGANFRNGLQRILGAEREIDFFTGLDQGPSAAARRAAFFFGDIIKSKIEVYFDRLLPPLVGKNGARQPSPELSVEERRARIDDHEARAEDLRSQIAAVELELSQLAEARGLSGAAKAATV